MTNVTVEVPDAITTELAQYGISDKQIGQVVLQVLNRWLEALEEREDVRDVAEAERLLAEDPGAFMTLEEFNAALDDEEAAS